MRSSGPDESVSRILDATLAAIANQGVRHLSMSEVCRVAGVARGTLYRYFPTREDLLNGIAEQVRSRFEADLAERAAQDYASPLACIDDIADFLADYASDPKSSAMLRVDPLYVLDFIAGQIENYSLALSKAVAPVLDAAQAQSGHKVDRLLWSQLMMRLQVSLFVLPPASGNAKTILRKYFRALMPALLDVEAAAAPIPAKRKR